MSRLESFSYSKAVNLLQEGTPIRKCFKRIKFNLRKKERFISPGDISYSTFTLIPSEWEVNSGAYMHWMVVMPAEKSPLRLTLSGYSKT